MIIAHGGHTREEISGTLRTGSSKTWFPTFRQEQTQGPGHTLVPGAPFPMPPLTNTHTYWSPNGFWGLVPGKDREGKGTGRRTRGLVVKGGGRSNKPIIHSIIC